MFRHTVLLTEAQIQERVTQMASAINSDCQNGTIDVVCILKGALFFSADLTRQLRVDLRIHVVQVSSYEDATSSGKIHLRFSSAPDLESRHVLIVEDILDTGVTLDYLTKHVMEKRPASLKICVMLDKKARRRVGIRPDYVGFEIDDHFVVGYGLDYRELGRNLPYIAILDPAEYQK